MEWCGGGGPAAVAATVGATGSTQGIATIVPVEAAGRDIVRDLPSRITPICCVTLPSLLVPSLSAYMVPVA